VPSVPAPSPDLPVPPLVAASQLRSRAFAECAAKRWEECVARFDEAKRLDAAGDTAPEVRAARTEARKGIDGKVKVP